MAFDPAPSSLFTSWSEDGTDITLPIASVDGLTAAEADGTTGDWRAVMHRLIEHTYDYIQTLAVADRPTKFTITRSRFDGADGELSYNFSVSSNQDIDTTSMAAE